MEAVDIESRSPKRIDSILRTAQDLLVSATILLIPVNIWFVAPIRVHSPHLRDALKGTTVIGPLDIVLLILIGVTCTYFIRHRSELKPVGFALGGMSAFVALSAVHLVISPTLEGSVLTFRLAGVVAVVAVVREMSLDRFSRGVVWPFVFTAGLQASLGLLQTLAFDGGRELSTIQVTAGHQWTAGVGTFNGPATMAAYLVLSLAVILSWARFRRLHPIQLISVGLSSAAVATTFGRAGVLALVLVAASYFIVWLRRRNAANATVWLVAALPMGVVGLITHSAWLVRAAQTIQLDAGGRGALIGRAFEMISMYPIFGVGPAQYGRALTRVGTTGPDDGVVHNVLIMIGAEFGIVVGIVATLWLLLVGVRSMGLGVHSAALFLVLTPHLLTESMHYVYPAGVAMFGLWLASLEFHSSQAALR